IYIKFFYYIHDKFKSFKISNYYKPAVGAVIVGTIAILFPEIMSVGYGWVQFMVNGSISSFPTFGLPTLLILVLLPFAKIVATSFSIGTGGSGGVFAPGIFVGASVGLLFGMLFHMIFPSLVTSVAPFVIVGMLALMGGAGKIPISVLLMITEMTGSLQLLPAAMIAVSMSYLISGQSTIYRSQVATRKESPAHTNEYRKPILESIKLKDLRLNDISVDARLPVSYAIKRMKEFGITSIPVVDKTGRKNRLGVIALLNMRNTYSEKVRAVAAWDIRMVKLDSSVGPVLDVMSEMKTTWVAVEDGNEYVGCITLKQIVNEYKKRLET
ncbi:MAG: chloride channel protein, partial [Candidatus Marsarchaeota archaeon]|nr:chloride channel protein [Candidatus Marsarchaeota archaeon]